MTSINGDQCSKYEPFQLYLLKPTLQELIEDLVDEPIEKYVVLHSFQIENMEYCHQLKALTKKHIYDLFISENHELPSVIIAIYERNKISKATIEKIF